MLREITEAQKNRTVGVQGDLPTRKKELRAGGKVQCKADVPVLYTLNISILLNSHKAIACNLCFQSCTVL